MANWRDNMMNSVSSEGVTITDGETTAVSASRTPSWEDYARASFSAEGLRVKGLSQKAVVPTANASNTGRIIQYVGETTDEYTKGYFYESTYTDKPLPEIKVTAKSSLDVQVDTGAFVLAVDEIAGDYEFAFNGMPTGFLATYNKIAIACLRDKTLDTGNAYGWTYTPPTSTATQYYYTDAEIVTTSSKLYLDTELTNPAPYTISSIDRSATEGYWAFAGKEAETNIGEYGISVAEGKAEVGDAFIVTLKYNNEYYWKNINVQDGGSGGDVEAEAEERKAADVVLQNNIDAEQTARIAGDAALEAKIGDIQTVLEAI